MQQERPWIVEEDEEAANRQTASLGGVAITLLLLVVGLFLVHELHAKAAIEDCLMAGRPCTAIWLVASGTCPIDRAALTRAASLSSVPHPLQHSGAGMRIAEMDWRMVEDWVRHDDRCALPLGSTEQHAGLSLATDAILAERVAAEAAEPLGMPVFPALPYGLTPYFTAFPGTVTLRVATYAAVLRDVLDSLKQPASAAC